MSDQLVVDLLRLLHLVGLAIGLGLALYADSNFLLCLNRSISESRLSGLLRIHRFVAASLVLLWLSGLCLLAVRTGFAPERISAKLIAKLVIVTLLTANAIMIGRVALPLLRDGEGLSFHELPTSWRLRLTTIGGISAGSWILALLLGTLSTFRSMVAQDLALFGASVLAAALVASTAIALSSPLYRLAVRLRAPRNSPVLGMPG